ncbi:MAG: PQQ-dependent sugar dehydrogenase [Alphaproteobacteria bacterium]|nr:PQQ-dependent sugar dehydrogenase [Alphaproteobacteria bacterium]
MKMRNVALSIVAFGVVGAIAGASFVGGFAVGRPDVQAVDYPQKVVDKLLGWSSLRVRVTPDQYKTQYDSIFLLLGGEIGTVPVERSGTGGGLTSFGEAILLITHEGRFFAARSASDIKELPIEAPQNGLAAYRQAAESERFKHFTHDFGKFRYNDILYYRSDVGHGLAVSYTEFLENQACYGTAIAVLTLDPDVRSVEQISAREEDWDVVYRTRPCLPLKEQWRAIEGHMAGGRIAFRAPATIYLGSGDYNWDGVYAPQAIAQRPDMPYGKVIAINLATRQARIVSLGHRNMQGIVFDRNGQLWVVEHGPRGGDELNRVVEGKNYGWPEEVLGTMYSTLPWPNTLSYGRHTTFTAPTFAWLPSVAISSLTLIEGFDASWDGDLLMATLMRQSLYRIRIRDNRVMFAERIPIGKRIRYAHQHTDGRLVLWTDDKNLIFLTVTQRNVAAKFLQDLIAKAGYDDDQRRRVEQALAVCMECHTFEHGGDANGPNLASIFNRPIARSDFGNYSDALKGHGGRWTREELMAFLNDPAAYAPGTVMPDPEIDDPFVLSALIDLMEGLGKIAGVPK